MRNVVWCTSGMRFFGELASRSLGWELMVDGYIGDCDTAYIVGMYDAPTYDKTCKMTERAKRRVIHWCGTDVLILEDASKLPAATHICDSDVLREELFVKGVDATTVMWPTRHHFPVTPLPDKPRVAAYLGSNPATYGNDMFVALANCFPDVKFHGFHFGEYDADAMEALCKKCSGIIRITRHDGSGASAREFMEAGRFAITTNGTKHAIRVRPDDLPQMVKALKAALRRTEPDLEASEYWKYQNSVERYLSDLEGVGIHAR